MTRSFRAPYWIDNSGKKFGKRMANRVLRARTTRIKKELTEDLDWLSEIAHIGGSYKKNYEQWNICDYRFITNDPKARRK